MEEIWKKKFKSKEVEFPNEITKEYCNQLYEITNKLVIAKIEKYDKNIDDMNSSIISIASYNPLLKKTTTEQYLGEVSGSSKFTYEIFLTGINTPDYKYRFCFIENGVYPYPVKVVMDTDIAKELGIETRTVCSNKEDYIKILSRILNSNKMTEVIEGLMSINSKMS